MPELPEVETTLRGVLPHLLGTSVTGITVRESRLRQPVPAQIAALEGQRFQSGRRRAKYLLFATEQQDTLLIHLGMSGSLRIAESNVQPRKHDHVILHLSSGRQLRYHDPRRFGCVLWLNEPEPESHHPLLSSLGPEPLGDAFTAHYLYERSRGKSAAVKTFIMDAKVVVGIGNIYACEALFLAGIRPDCAAGRVTLPRYQRLVAASRQVLSDAIQMGGTTLRDFVREDGQPGYFKQSLRVYDRQAQPCFICATPIQKTVLGQRATYFCPTCQKR